MRVEPIYLRDTEADDSTWYCPFQRSTPGCGCTRAQTGTTSLAWIDLFVPPIAARKGPLGEHVEYVEQTVDEWDGRRRQRRIEADPYPSEGKANPTPTPSCTDAPQHRIVLFHSSSITIFLGV